MLHYLRKKHWLKLGLLAVSLLGYTLLVNVSYPNGAEQFYIENLYLPLSIFVAFPLVFDVLPSWPQKKVLLGLAFVLLIRLVHIGFSHQFYTTRLHYLQEYLLQTAGDKEQKLILSSGQFPKDTLLMTWASPYEFWLLSTISTGTSRSITILDQPEAVEWAKDQKESFLTQWGVFPYAELPTRYFIFQDSSNYVWKLE